jgi:hypothetical protein
MIRPTVALLLIAGAALAEAPAPRTPGPISQVIKDGDRQVLEYCYGGDLFKPYVAKLFSPSGVNVLRDQIADHPHHHGLMFAVAVDGVDFWAENQKCGREVSKAFRPTKDTPSEFPEAAVIDNQLQWVGPQGGQTLARENRKITNYTQRQMGASLLAWQTKLQPPEGKASITLSGNHYFGLGMRFVQSMDGADDFFTPDGKSKTRLGEAAGETVRGNERLVRGKWCAYAAQADGRPVTVAMFDHPSNVRPAWWFIMAKPFAYLSATLNLHREPLTVEAGKPLVLTYGVAVWDGKVKADEIEKLYARWLELPAAKAESAGAGK